MLLLLSSCISPHNHADGKLICAQWDGGWLRGVHPMNFDIDATHITGNGGKMFMAVASPWFFMHYTFKNFLWYGNDFQYSTRWEQLIDNRDKVNIVEVIYWTHYGESHYIYAALPHSRASTAADGLMCAVARSLADTRPTRPPKWPREEMAHGPAARPCSHQGFTREERRQTRAR